MIKIIFFDLDGTVLSHKTNSVPESTVKAFHLLHDKNIKLFTCTGRNLQEINDLKPLHVLQFDGHALFTGHYCFDHTSTIFDCPMDKEDIQEILHYSDIHQITACLNIHQQEDMFSHLHHTLMTRWNPYGVDFTKRSFTSIYFRKDDPETLLSQQSFPGCSISRRILFSMYLFYA